ncbi:MAG: zinc-ribbon domain containing protein [bacterium]
MFADKILTCRECGREFVFTAGEQEFYAEKGFENEPGRCPECRAARKQSSRRGGQREMFPAVCAACGRETQVPFRPSGERPVYCSDCFRERQTR